MLLLQPLSHLLSYISATPKLNTLCAASPPQSSCPVAYLHPVNLCPHGLDFALSCLRIHRCAHLFCQLDLSLPQHDLMPSTTERESSTFVNGREDVLSVHQWQHTPEIHFEHRAEWFGRNYQFPYGTCERAATEQRETRQEALQLRGWHGDCKNKQAQTDRG